MTTVAELIVQTLCELKVNKVFGVTGGAIEPLYDEISKARDKITPVLARHEASAAYMASAYGRETNKPGVCLVTSGPGVTNTVTAVAEANDSGSPLLVISAQPSLSDMARGPLQDSFFMNNTVDLLKPVTAKSYFMSHANQFPYIFLQAISRCLSYPRHPVHISIPSDVFLDETCSNSLRLNLEESISSGIEAQKLDELTQDIVSAKQVVFLLGRFCDSAVEEVWTLIDNLPHAKVISSPEGKKSVRSSSKYHGVLGIGGHNNAERLLQEEETELVILVGFDANVFSTGYFSKALMEHPNLAMLSNCNEVTSKILNPTMRSYKNIKASLDYLNKQEFLCSFPPQVVKKLGLEFESDKWKTKTNPIKPQWLFYHIVSLLHPDTRYVIDLGSCLAWASHYLHPDNARSYYCNYSFAPMGYSIGTAIGVAFANPKKTVVAILGDGSFLMEGFGFTVALEYQLKIIFIVLNDGCYNMVRHGQKLNKAEAIGYVLPQVEFYKIAESVGMKSFIINSSDDFIKFTEEYSSSDAWGPVLLDVRIDREEIPPMGVRIKSMESAP